jgi:WD40 repeat protein
VVIVKLPLDSPLWGRLSACCSKENAVARLREIVATRQLGEAWNDLRGEMLHQGSVYGVSSAVIPHLVEVAPYLSAKSRRDLWIEIGFLITAGADEFPSPPAPGLQAGLTAALVLAEAIAVRDFATDADVTPSESSDYALACVALAGHRVGRAMWEFVSPGSGYVRVLCPRCDAEYEVDGFGDPLALPCPAPAFSAVAGESAAWHDMADVIDGCGRDQVLGPGWAGFFETARRVAAEGVPTHASTRAVWCLVAAMVATKPQAVPWARTLARLTGWVRCLECDLVWTVADVMGDDRSDAEPVDVAIDEGPHEGQDVLFAIDGDPRVEDPRSRRRAWRETVADGVAGFRTAPGRRQQDAQMLVRTLWRADGAPVDTLTVVAGQPSVIAAGTSDAVTLWDADSGSPVGAPLDGRVVAVASVALPDGSAVIVAAGDDGGLRWWDASTGRPLDGMPMADSAGVLSLAPVYLPPDPVAATVDWLARIRDGRTVLAAGDSDGVVRLWDAAHRTPLTELFQRPGRPVTSLTAVDFVTQSPWHGTEVFALYDDWTVDVWSSTAVHGQRSKMAPESRKLVAIGHQRLVGAAMSPDRLGYRRPVLLADRNGAVSMWETFGVRLTDPLPPDPVHREVVGIVALPWPGDGIVVATASRGSPSLRLWKPQSGGVTLVPLDVQPRCLLNVGPKLVVGHDDGLIALSLASAVVEA